MGAVHGVHLPWHDHASAEAVSGGPQITYHHWIKAIRTVFTETTGIQKEEETVSPEYMSNPHRQSIDCCVDCGGWWLPEDPDPPKPLGWLGPLPPRTLIYHRFDDADSDATCQAGGDHRPTDVEEKVAKTMKIALKLHNFDRNSLQFLL